jgi:hypothetical protein
MPINWIPATQAQMDTTVKSKIHKNVILEKMTAINRFLGIGVHVLGTSLHQHY